MKQDCIVVISHIFNLYETLIHLLVKLSNHACYLCFCFECFPTFIPHAFVHCVCVWNCRCNLWWQRHCVWHSCPLWPRVPPAWRPWPTAHLWQDFTWAPRLFLPFVFIKMCSYVQTPVLFFLAQCRPLLASTKQGSILVRLTSVSFTFQCCQLHWLHLQYF